VSLDARLFLDASFTIALAVPKDNYHTRALVLMDRILAERPHLVTTRSVLLEIGDRLGKVQNRAKAVQALVALESDPLVQIVPLSIVLYESAFQLFQTRPDKEWGMTDCVSFVVMQEMGLMSSLTADRHFREAGFRALLRDD
jgi:predicted nucleic acid-binding protein